jgi:putative ABC transport system permease protein
METLMQDVRYGFRMLLKNPAFTAVAVMALALAIGANTAIYSVINAVLLGKLPYGDPDRIVVVWGTNPNLASPDWRIRSEVAPGNFFDWREQNQVFEQLAAFRNQPFTLTGGGSPEQIMGNAVTANMLSTLKVAPARGRDFLPENEVPGANRVVIIGHGLWQRLFGSDPNIIGQTLMLNSQPYNVIGIMPQGFEFPGGSAELCVPLVFDAQQRNSRGVSFLYTRGRLKPDATVEQAQAEMDAISSLLREQYPDANRDKGARVVLLQDETVSAIKPALLMLLAAVGFVLLIACANVGNLMLARSASRQKEIAIRTALGAGRLRLIRQLLTESILLSAVGGFCGLLLAFWGVGAIRASIPQNLTSGVYGWERIEVNGSVLIFTFVVSVVTGIVFGLVPALQASRTDLVEPLNQGGRHSSGSNRKRLRSALVISEVTLAMMLLLGAGLVLKSFFRLLEVNPGFDPQNLTTVRLFIPQNHYTNNSQVMAFYNESAQRLKSLPGVESVAWINNLPMGGSSGSAKFLIEGRDTAAQEKQEASFRIASPGYFDAMKIPIMQGRDFTEQDNEGAPQVVVINEAIARLYFPNENPVGKRLLDPQKNIPWEIVGVVGDVKHRGLDDKAQECIYRPSTQLPQRSMFLVMRTAPEAPSMAAALRREIQTVDKDLPVSDIKSMTQRVSETNASRRLVSFLLVVFACVALFLATEGIYGVTSYSVTQRTQEIGIRMAFGARPVDILRLIVSQSMIMVLIGVALGLAGSIALAGLISSFLFGVTPTDPATLAVMPLLLVGVALLACFVPARNAMKVDPMVAMRHE